jgi:hypothetical protein
MGDREDMGVSGDGRTLASPGGFANDDGAPDLAIRNARSPEDRTWALLAGRVLVAVVANADEVDESGADKSSDMSVVSMISGDGRRGLLAFSGLDSLKAWNPQARPVPVSGTDAAKAALEDGCEALVLDVAGPSTAVVPELDLLAVAGIDPLDYAAAILDRHLDDASVVIDRNTERLRVLADAAAAQHAAANIPARILALVPAGVEIVTED